MRALRRDHEHAEHRDRPRRQDPRHVCGCRCRECGDGGAEAHGADLRERGARDSGAHSVGHCGGFGVAIVAVHGLTGRAADRRDELRPIVLEPARRPAGDSMLMRSAAAVDVLGNRLPLTQGTGHHPVDHVVNLRLDLPRHICHHVALELVLDPRLVHQVRQASDAQRVVEEAHTAILELVENVVDLRQPELELSSEIGPIGFELPIDVVDRGDVVPEQRHPAINRRASRLRQASADAEGIEKLQAQALTFVEGRADVVFELVETIVRDRLANRLAKLLPQSATRRHGEDGRLRSECLGLFGDEDANLLTLLGSLEDIDLVHHDDDLLAPVLDGLEERALRLGERPVGGGHEETRSARGTNSVVSRSCSRKIALVPGVSTMVNSLRSETGALITSAPDESAPRCGAAPYRNICSFVVVGVAPSSRTRAPTSAFTNALLPALNSPMTTRRKSCSSCARD